MTRQDVQKHSHTITAFMSGKIIECLDHYGYWYEVPDPSFRYDKTYRVKGESETLVPFTFNDHLLFRDKWFKYKDNAFGRRLRLVSYETDSVTIHNRSFNYKEFLDKYEFDDGSPCGKYV